jgi:ornithine cyclodeaminase
MSIRLLDLSDIKKCISMDLAIDAMETAFIQLANNQIQMPLRNHINIEAENAQTLTMPGFIEKGKILGLKVVSLFPNNKQRNKPAINGLIMLFDATTGEAKTLMDAAYLTALRTGAVSGLATKFFAKKDAKHVAIIGSGVQAITQLEAVASVRDIQSVSVWSRTRVNAEKFVSILPSRYKCTVHDSVASAVKEADIICTATSSQEPLVTLHDLQPHAHINAIGSHTSSMCEINNDVLGQAVVIVDQLDAALVESGEIISAIQNDIIKKESILELGKWLLHKKSDYENELTVFKSVGLAIQDLSVAELVYQQALKKKLGTEFSFSLPIGN